MNKWLLFALGSILYLVRYFNSYTTLLKLFGPKEISVTKKNVLKEINNIICSSSFLVSGILNIILFFLFHFPTLYV